MPSLHPPRTCSAQAVLDHSTKQIALNVAVPICLCIPICLSLVSVSPSVFAPPCLVCRQVPVVSLPLVCRTFARAPAQRIMVGSGAGAVCGVHARRGA